MSEWDLEEELLGAALVGDEKKVTRLLQQGVHVNCYDGSGDTPLHKAASGGHVGVAELLLKAGAQVDSKAKLGATALHKAASEGHVGVAELLLKAGAQVDSILDNLVETPLYKAASGGHVGVAELLLKAGAQVDSRGGLFRSGDTPLCTAAEEGHVGVTELLLKAGAQVDSRDGREDTALHIAASRGHVGVVELLLKAGAQLDSKNGYGATALHNAASEGHVGVTELLLKAGAQVDSRDGVFQSGATALHKAASKGHVGVAELLLKAGAQVDSRDGSGATALHRVAEGGHVGVAELLLKAGAQLDIKDNYGRTPKDVAESGYYRGSRSPVSQPVLEGRKKILELIAAQKMGWPCRHKVGPEGGELLTKSCTVTVPRGAVTMETEITSQVINPNEVNLPLEDGAMLVSDIVELGPHGTTFHQPVTVHIQYNSASLDGAREAAVWVTEDSQQWTELKTTKEGKDKLAVSVDHFSLFAVISRPKRDMFTVPTEGFKLTSSTQPAVQISFPEQAVNTPTQVTIQVQEVPKRAVKEIKAKDQSFHNLVSTSPIVNVETVSDSEVQFQKPITVRVPHPQRYMDSQDEEDTKLRVMSCEEGTEDWVDETDNTDIRETEEFVEFEVSHFTRWIVIVVTDIYDDPKELGPIPLNLCRWLQHRAVQFILMQREDNANEFIIECVPSEDATEKRATLLQEGYKGPVPTDSVDLFEGQMVEISLLGNVWIAEFGLESSAKPKITFHSQKSNRLHMQVMALEARGQEGLDGKGSAAFFALPRVEVKKQKVRKALLRKGDKTHSNKPGGKLHQPTFLCQLPIHVPYEIPKMTTEQDAGASKGIARCFFFIKENVSTDWMDLAFYLGFKGADISNIDHRNRDDKSRCRDLLLEWQKRDGDAATAEVLVEALSKAKLKRVVDGLKNQFPDIVIPERQGENE